jgi:hypothetical protein
MRSRRSRDPVGGPGRHRQRPVKLHLDDHGQGHPAIPGGPAAELILVQAAQALAKLEGLLDPPPLPGPTGTRVARGTGRGVQQR